MATDFFQRQADARKSTAWLIMMFCIAVVAIMGSVAALAYGFVVSQTRDQTFSDDPSAFLVPAVAALVALLLIVGGTLYKVLELRRGGGTLVAERMGGQRIYPNSDDPVARRLLNVVEEMAIASGTPVPPVFMMQEEDGINAFAAGYTPSDAVLGVTRGCAESLTRDELQGVIAHEFSHILNGDMRMNIRLIGILHGILLLGLAGQMVLRSLFYAGHGRTYRRGNNDKEKGGGMLFILVIAVGLVVIGFVGTFIGNLIKAAVSRQREYLADASAVQFTRNPSGLAGALKRIGGAMGGSRLVSPNASEASHMFFSAALRQGLAGLWATHPPLSKRILAIDPAWDGKFPQTQAGTRSLETDLVAGFAASSGAAVTREEVPTEIVDDAVNHVGEPTSEHQAYAVSLLREIPNEILEAAREPYGGRAVMYGLLLDRRTEIRATQRRTLEKHATTDVVALTGQLLPIIDALDVRMRLPLIELTLPALRAMSLTQYNAFATCFGELVRADAKIDLFEWTLSQILTRHLRPQFERIQPPRIQFHGLQRLRKPTAVLLSAVSYAGNSDEQAGTAFSAAVKHLPELALSLLHRNESSLSELQASLKTLAKVVAKQRGRLVDACAEAICADRHVKWQEAELLRGISDLLDCPMPPLVVGPSKRG